MRCQSLPAELIFPILQPSLCVGCDLDVVRAGQALEMRACFGRSDVRESPGALARKCMTVVVGKVVVLDEGSLRQRISRGRRAQLLERRGDVFVTAVPWENEKYCEQRGQVGCQQVEPGRKQKRTIDGVGVLRNESLPQRRLCDLGSSDRIKATALHELGVRGSSKSMVNEGLVLFPGHQIGLVPRPLNDTAVQRRALRRDNQGAGCRPTGSS